MKIYDDGKIFGKQVIIPKAIQERRNKFIDENYPHASNFYVIISLFIIILCKSMEYNHDSMMNVILCLSIGFFCLLCYVDMKYNEQAEEGFENSWKW